MKPQSLLRSLPLVVVLCVGCAAHTPGQPDAPGADPTQAEAAPDYRIGPEDVVEVAVWRNDAVSRTVPVRPDGAISLPLINDVQAAGLTPMQLRDQIVKRLATYISQPEVSVIIREVHSSRVTVLGQVIHPGLYEMRGPETVMELVAHAGGLSPFASRSSIVVVRNLGGHHERFNVDADDAISDKPGQNLALRSGDLVYVP